MMKAPIISNKGTGNEPDVTKEDQEYINEFSRLHAKNKGIDVEIKKWNDIMASLEDAVAAIDESFGANIKMNIGESFVEVGEDDARVFVEKQQKKVEDSKKALIDKYDKNRKRLDNLKIILYAKFEKNINLEED